LDVVDLSRLCPTGRDLFSWAREHLRAVIDKGYPTLVPLRAPGGACHWLVDGRCAVHAAAPYSCAFFDAHMTEEEIERRSRATVQARKQDAAARGLYFQVWSWLVRQNLTVASGDRAALARAVAQLRSVM
jgi:hypothetical protein